jgi:hypothetical protein
MRSRNRLAPGRTSPRHRSDVRGDEIPDRTRSASPTDRCRLDCPSGSRRSDAHIEVVDVPRHLQGVRAAAACEGGLAPEFRRSGRELKPLDIVGLCYLDALWRSAGRDWSRIARFGPNGI